MISKGKDVVEGAVSDCLIVYTLHSISEVRGYIPGFVCWKLLEEAFVERN